MARGRFSARAKKGGETRAKNLSKERKSEIARLAAKARWEKAGGKEIPRKGEGMKKPKVMILAGDPFDTPPSVRKSCDVKLVSKTPNSIPHGCSAVFALEKFSSRDWRAKGKDLARRENIPFVTVSSVTMLKNSMSEMGLLKPLEKKGAQEPRQEAPPKVLDEETVRSEAWGRFADQVREWVPIICERPVGKQTFQKELSKVLEGNRGLTELNALIDTAVEKGVVVGYNQHGIPFYANEMPKKKKSESKKSQRKRPPLHDQSWAVALAPMVGTLQDKGPYKFKSHIIPKMAERKEFHNEQGKPRSRVYYETVLAAAGKMGVVYKRGGAYYIRPANDDKGAIKAPAAIGAVNVGGPPEGGPQPLESKEVVPAGSMSVDHGAGGQAPAPTGTSRERTTTRAEKEVLASIGLSMEMGVGMDVVRKLVSKLLPEEREAYEKKGLESVWSRISQDWDSFVQWLDTSPEKGKNSRHKDLERWCKECDRKFIWTARDQAIFEEQAFYPPSRCLDCRKAQRKSSAPGSRF